MSLHNRKPERFEREEILLFRTEQPIFRHASYGVSNACGASTEAFGKSRNIQLTGEPRSAMNFMSLVKYKAGFHVKIFYECRTHGNHNNGSTLRRLLGCKKLSTLTSFRK